MKLRQYKKIMVNTIKKAKSREIIVLRYDMNKIYPYVMSCFMKNITKQLDNNSKIIAIPSVSSIKKMSIEDLRETRDIIDKTIDKIEKGE